MPMEMLIFQKLYFLFVPENCIVDISGEIPDQIKPSGLFALLVFVEQVSQ